MPRTNSYIYYNNGIHEKRIPKNGLIPEGWVKGRIIDPTTTKGMIKINNGVNERCIKPTDPIPNGWAKGRIKGKLNPSKQSATMKSKKFHYYNNGTVEIMIAEKDIIPSGFVKGRLPMTESQKEKLRLVHVGKKIPRSVVEKTLETKKRRHTLNSSSEEEDMYRKLVEAYGKSDVERNYKDIRYPYRCDFYIKSKDLFIELNAHWTHGGRPFDPNDESCRRQLKEWGEKAKQSQFYRNAIYTWTVRDVEKRQKAKESKINYITLY